MQTYTIPKGTKELKIETYNDKIVIEFLPEKKIPIFTTEDGVELYNREDECWYVRLSDNVIGEQPFVHKEMAYHVNFKYFSARKAAEEYAAKKSWKPKDGDIIANSFPTVAIFNSTSSTGGVMYYAAILKGHLNINDDNPCIGIGYTVNYRPATESEKQLLFAKLAEAGYRWNVEAKKIEKVRWRAKKGEKYWTFTSTGVFDVSDYRYASDNERYNNGFYFQTKEQAEKALEAVKNLLLNTKF